MHILMHGQLAWPCILHFLDESPTNLTDPSIESLLTSYKSELGTYPGGYDKDDVDALYKKVITYLSVAINQTHLPHYENVLKQIFNYWHAANKSTTQFFDIASTILNPVDNKALLAYLLTGELDTNQHKGLLAYTKYSQLIEKLNLNVSERADLINTVYLCSESLLQQDTSLLANIGIRTPNDLINYICFNNDPHSIWIKLSDIQDDYKVLQKMYLNTELEIDACHPIPML